MSEHATPATERLSRRKRYKRLMYGILWVGILGFLVGMLLDRFLVGLAVYWLGFAGFVGVWKGSSVDLFDERDRTLERRAGAHTLTLFAYLLPVVFPGALALETLDYVSLPAEFLGAMYALCTVYLVYGAVYTVVRYRA